MKPGLLDTFPGASWDISWAYWIVSWTIFDGNIDILARISSSNMPRKSSKDVQEIDQYIQETCQDVQETCVWVKVTCT